MDRESLIANGEGPPVQRRSAVIARTVVGIVSTLGFILSALLIMYTAMSCMGRDWHPLTTLILALLAAGCLLTSAQLLHRKTWAWWSALGISVVIFGFGVFACWAAFFSKDPYVKSEAISSLLVGVFCMLPGVLSGVLLTLPAVRRYYLSNLIQT